MCDKSLLAVVTDFYLKLNNKKHFLDDESRQDLLDNLEDEVRLDQEIRDLIVSLNDETSDADIIKKIVHVRMKYLDLMQYWEDLEDYSSNLAKKYLDKK